MISSDPTVEIKNSISNALTIKLSLVFTACTVLAGIALYASTDIPLPPTYGEIIARVGAYQALLFRDSMYIYAIFTVLMLGGSLALCLIYSHRVAGPLYRVRVVAREAACGNFEQVVRFRKNDCIKPMADTLNALNESYCERHAVLVRDTERLDEEALKLDAAARRGDEIGVRNAIHALDLVTESLEQTLSELKF